jgi:hypothetical protein
LRLGDKFSGNPLGVPSEAAARRHGLRVRSVLVLLRPEADGPAVTCNVRHVLPEDDDYYLDFRYHVVRIWEVPAEQLLAGGLGILPLAPIAAVQPEIVVAETDAGVSSMRLAE